MELLFIGILTPLAGPARTAVSKKQADLEIVILAW